MDAIAVGSVFRPDWDSRLHRVLLMDHIEVLYDVCWPHTKEWGFSNPDGEGQYYRILTSVLQNRSTALRAEPLTDVELAMHRPDLPQAINGILILRYLRDGILVTNLL